MPTQLSGNIISLRIIFEVQQSVTKTAADTVTADNITIQCSYAILVVILADNAHYENQNMVHYESKIIQS
jgi:hypothetical protein